MSSRQARFATRAMRTTILSGFLASQMIPAVMAQPSGGTVVGGQGLITQSGVLTRIDQSSDRLIIEWDSFDTSTQETVRFFQPSQSAMALNRVLSGQATQFNGSLFANGNVVIVNGAGIHFGPTSYVDVGGLIASTADITNSNFLSNRLIFDQAGDPDAMVTNAGTITARDAGLAALVAPGVENSGLIRAQLGTVILASGETHTIDFRGDGLISFALTSPTTTTPRREDDSEADALVTNSGTVEADGGSVVITASQASRVLDTAINMSGVAQANSVGVRNGRIVLGGGGAGRVRVSGQVSARGTSAGTTGGTVHVTGEEIAVEDARIDASGVDGGGTVLVGGAERGQTLEPTGDVGYLNEDDLLTVFLGSNAAALGSGFMPLASHTTVDAASFIDASSSASNGGDVIIWGTDSVHFHGMITTLGGDNGFVEVSTLGTGVIDGIAQTGSMLVDPGDVCVTTGNDTSGCAAGATNLADTTIEMVLDQGGLFELNTDSTGTSGTGRVDFGGAGNVAINNTTGTMGTFIIHAADEINTQQVGFVSDGTTGTNFEWYAGSSLTGAPVASADIVLLGQNFVTGGGHVIFDAADDISIGDPLQTGGGDVTLIARGGDAGATTTFASSDARIQSGGGTITIQTDTLQVNATAISDPLIDAGTGTVHLLTTTVGRTIDLGTETAGGLGLTDTTIDRIAADTFRIGSADAGDIIFYAAINPARADTLSLITGGAIRDENSTGDDITVANLALQTSSGIADDDFLEMAVTTLALGNTDDLVSISNTGALTIGTVDGVTGLTAGGDVDIQTASPLTFAANISTGGNLTATAGDTGAANADNIAVNAGVTVQSTGGNVTFRAGDDVILGAGATVSANGTLNLTAGHNDTDGDGGLSFGPGTLNGSTVNLTAINDITLGALNAAGGMVDIISTAGAIIDGNDPVDGTLNITAQSLSLSANTGIGGTGGTATIETQVSNLEAQTGTGGIFLENTGNLTIGGVTGALNGVRVLTAGDIELTNAGRIDINVAGERVMGPAAVTVIANGATADILTGSNTVTPNATVQSSGGTVTLRAGQDLLLGDTAGAGTLGNVFGGRGVVLDAGRDIIVDTGTFIQASGAGTIMANAGRDISVVDTSGPFTGAEIRTEGGDITLTTGAGGVFTANNGASPAVRTTVLGGNGNITINADAMDIQNSILAGTGIVTLSALTAGRTVDLGTNSAGSLGLTDAELDFITASMLRIGSTTGGSIDVTGAISPANVSTLSLITGNAITDNNAAGADITVTNLAMQAVNGIGSADAIDTGVSTVAAVNSTSGSIRLFQLTGLGNLRVGTVDGVVGVSNQATVNLGQTRIQTEASNLIINNDVFSALDPLLLGAGGNNLLDNNAAVSTGAGFGIDLQGSSMALEGGTITAGSNGRVRINPVFVGQAVDLGSISDAGAGLELSAAELDTITAGTLQIGQLGIGDIIITDGISPANVSTLALETSGAVLDSNLGTDITVDNLVVRTGAGFGVGDAIGLDVNNLAFSNTGGVVNLINIGDLTITALDGLTTSSNTGTTTTINATGLLTFAANTSSIGNATFTAPTITVNNGVDVDVSTGALAFNATTIDLDGNLTAATGISGTATTVNVIGSTGGAEIQDAVDVAATGATVNVGDGTFAGGITIDKALSMLGDGFTNTTTVNVADGTAGMTVTASGVSIDGFLFTGDGTPVNATGVLVDATGGALSNILIGDANADTLGSRFTGLTIGLQVQGGGNTIGLNIGLGNVFDTSTDGIVLDGSSLALTGNTFNDTSFAGITGDYIRLENGAAFLPGSPTVLDATLVTFDGTLGSDLTVAQAIAVEDGLIHYLDDPTLGLINIGQLVVSNGNSIQLAVNVAGALGQDTVTVGAGTYGGSVEVWVDNLTLRGQGATTIIDTDAIDAFANNGDVDNGFQVAAISVLSGGGDVTGVTIDGFAFDTVTTSGNNIGVELGEAGVSTAVNAIVQNSSFDDLLNGIFSNQTNGITTIAGNSLTAITNRGINFSDAIIAGEQVIITGNTVSSLDAALIFVDTVTEADITITGNTLASTAANDALIFDGAVTDSTVVIGGATAADANDISGFDDGIDIGVLSGGTFSVLNNTRIVGNDITSGDGVEFDDFIRNGADVQIAGNTLIQGDQNGVVFERAIIDSTVTIDGNTEILGGTDGISILGAITNSRVGITGNTVEGAADGIDLSGAIGSSTELTIAQNLRIEGLGTFADEDGLSDGIAFRGAVSGATTSILIDDNTLIRGSDRGINFADSTTGGPATATNASITISRNDEIRGTTLDGILFNADLTDATIVIGGATSADGNGLIIGNDEGLDIENVIGGSFTIANNTRIEGETGDAVEFEGRVRSDAVVTIQDNATITGATNGIIFERAIIDSTVTIDGNTEIRGVGVDGISILNAIDSTIAITGNTGIYGDGFDGIFVEEDLIDTDVSIDGNVTIAGAIDGISLSAGNAAPGLIGGGSISITGNGSITGTTGNGILAGGLVSVNDIIIASNDEIRGGGEDGIAIFGAILSTIAITDNTGIYGDGLDGIYIAAGLLDSDFAVSSNDEIVGSDDGMNLGAILGGSFSVDKNMLINGGTGSGLEFEGPVFGVATFVVENNDLIIGGEEAIEFDTPASITDSSLRFSANSLQAGTDGMLFDGLITDSTIITEENTIIAGANGISLANLGGSSSFSVDMSSVTGGLNGLTVTGSNAGGGDSVLTLGETSFNGVAAAGIAVTTQAGGSSITTEFEDGVVTTGLPSLAMSGPNQAIAGNTIGNVAFNSIGGGNFITLSNGALFEPGRPTIILGTGATFDGVTIGGNVERPTIDWVESRIIDFDDNATLGQIFFFNLPYLFDTGFGDGPVRMTNIQTPGDWILRPDLAFQILATNPLADDYGLGTCLFEYSETSQRLVPRCIAPVAGSDPSPSILRFMEGMEQLSALQ